jgi:hypothetical protein
MPFITVNSGGVDIPDGVYPVTLVEIKGPKTVTAQRGPKAGQEIDLLDWVFAVDEGDHDGTQIEASTSTASGPKSKMYSYLTALFGGIAPTVGATFETTDLCGRRALATIRKDDNGWPRIENLGAMPAAMQQKAFAKATGAPVKANGAPAPAAAAGTPLRDQVAGEPAAGDLPF